MIDTPGGEALLNQELSAQYLRGLQPKNILKTLWRNITGSSPEQLAWLHTNHLGAPQAATGAGGQVLWQASYAAFGAARTVGVSGFTQNLRLPGQYFDAETGLHYNRHRYYDPARGEYLTPDPLGTPDGPNPYAYVRYNPLKYVDPDGLILFAFDGTGNTEASKTNVYWLREAYNDNDDTKNTDGSLLFENTAAKPFYIEGPGTGQFLDGALAYSLRGRIDTQLGRLDDYVKAKWQNEIDVQKKTYSKEAPLIITLDIMGFSRGAAAARDFANQVIDRKNRNYYNKDLFGFGGQDDTRYNCVGIKLRFMGLFDTVLSTAVGNFNTGISNSQIEYVAQAVAVNEHRVKFPLLSIDDSAGAAGFTANRVEKGFIGAHSDIGGGYAGSDGDGGDLSDVALNWMHAQAVSAGVTLKPLEADQLKVSNPILHDETRVAPWNLPGFGGLSSDRTITYLDQSSAKMKAAQTEGMTYTQSQQGQTDSQDKYINYHNYYAGNKAGLVDMDKYKQWLQGQGITIQ